MKSKLSTAQITKIALMIAFISVSSYIVIPLPFTTASITGQTLAVNLVALVLEPGEAFFTLVCYWLLGLVGAPVFAGGTSGPGKMFGPTGGYYIGFVIAAVAIAFLKGKKYNMVRYSLIAVLIGIPVIDGLGLIWMKFIGGMTWKAAFVGAVLPFIPLDIVKCIAAALLAKPIRSAFYALEGNTGEKLNATKSV
ncbi:MAG: biotin transporter BioY [Lachnospiraceae bacterium]|nr:biotin transporter BioY [Lachnospiraceae bacterium]